VKHFVSEGPKLLVEIPLSGNKNVSCSLILGNEFFYKYWCRTGCCETQVSFSFRAGYIRPVLLNVNIGFCVAGDHSTGEILRKVF
jgi:hypothetical protein